MSERDSPIYRLLIIQEIVLKTNIKNIYFPILGKYKKLPYFWEDGQSR